MTAHRWLTKRHSSLLSRACSTEGSCGSPSSRDRRRHHVLGRPRRRGAAPRRIVRWLDRRRAHPRLLRASPPVFSSRAADKVGTRPPPSHSPPHDAQPVHSRRQGARNAQFGLEMPPPRVGGALGSGAAPRRANLRDKLATSVPRIHPRFCPIQAHPVPRAASRAKFAPFPTSSSRPNADLRPPGGPGRGSGPARCGFSTALRCICAPMERSGVRLRRVDCGAPR